MSSVSVKSHPLFLTLASSGSGEASGGVPALGGAPLGTAGAFFELPFRGILIGVSSEWRSSGKRFDKQIWWIKICKSITNGTPHCTLTLHELCPSYMPFYN